MRRRSLLIGLVFMLSLAACAPATVPIPVPLATLPPALSMTPTVTLTPPSPVTDTPTPTPTQIVSLPPTDTSTPTVADTPTSSETSTLTPTATGPTPCTSERASLDLSASPENPKVGDMVKVTLRVTNMGCLALGVPQYRLGIESDGAIFSPASPEPVVHSLAVSPGETDAAVFDLQAIAAGQASLTASVSYEVHIGYPGPAYWGITGLKDPVVLTVAP